MPTWMNERHKHKQSASALDPRKTHLTKPAAQAPLQEWQRPPHEQVHVNVHVCVRVHVHEQVHVHVNVRVRVRVHVHVHVHVQVHVQMDVQVHAQGVHVHVHLVPLNTPNEAGGAGSIAGMAESST